MQVIDTNDHALTVVRAHAAYIDHAPSYPQGMIFGTPGHLVPMFNEDTCDAYVGYGDAALRALAGVGIAAAIDAGTYKKSYPFYGNNRPYVLKLEKFVTPPIIYRVGEGTVGAIFTARAFSDRDRCTRVNSEDNVLSAFEYWKECDNGTDLRKVAGWTQVTDAMHLAAEGTALNVLSMYGKMMKTPGWVPPLFADLYKPLKESGCATVAHAIINNI